MKSSISSNINAEIFNAYKWDVKMYKIPIAFIPTSFTDVFENIIFSVLTNCQLANYVLQFNDKLVKHLYGFINTMCIW